MAYVVIGNDGFRPVVWGVGETEDAAARDAAEQEGSPAWEQALQVSDAIEAQVREGVVGCEELGLVHDHGAWLAPTQHDYSAACCESDTDPTEFQNQVLSIGSEFLPDFAQRVRDGSEPTPKFWAFMIKQVSEASAKRESGNLLLISATDGGTDSCVVCVGGDVAERLEYARSTVESRVYQGLGERCTAYEVYDQDARKRIGVLERSVMDHGQTVSRTVRARAAQ